MTTMAPTCAQCGKPIARGYRGRRYCSGTCRARACDQRARTDGRFEQWAASRNAHRRKPRVLLVCPYCNRHFETPKPETVRSCGAEACVRAHNATKMRLFHAGESIASLARPKRAELA